jgi:hypothetical protein
MFASLFCNKGVDGQSNVRVAAQIYFEKEAINVGHPHNIVGSRRRTCRWKTEKFLDGKVGW